MAERNRSLPGFILPLLVLTGLSLLALLALVVLSFDAVGVGLFVGFALLFLLLCVYLPYRVYLDAEERGTGVAARYAGVLFVLPFVGAVGTVPLGEAAFGGTTLAVELLLLAAGATLASAVGYAGYRLVGTD